MNVTFTLTHIRMTSNYYCIKKDISKSIESISHEHCAFGISQGHDCMTLYCTLLYVHVNCWPGSVEHKGSVEHTGSVEHAGSVEHTGHHK